MPTAAPVRASTDASKATRSRYGWGSESAMVKPSVAAAAAVSPHGAKSGEPPNRSSPEPTSTGTTVATAAGIAIS